MDHKPSRILSRLTFTMMLRRLLYAIDGVRRPLQVDCDVLDSSDGAIVLCDDGRAAANGRTSNAVEVTCVLLVSRIGQEHWHMCVSACSLLWLPM